MKILKQLLTAVAISTCLSASAQWTQQGTEINGEAADDWSGFSVSMSADGLTVAIGAFLNDGSGSDAGHVRVYKLIGGVWTQQGADIDGAAAGDYSGLSVSMSADGLTLAIGAPGNDDSSSEAGHTRVYKLIGGVWTQQGADIVGEAAGDSSGWKVSISADGLTVAIATDYNDGGGTDAGNVRVYKLIGGVWTQQGADIDGEAAGDLSGYSVSISADGLTVAIGAIDNDDSGTDAGHVRVYKLIGGVWTQQGADIDGEAAGDLSGFSVSMSEDGLTVAVGAYRNDSSGSDAGHVRIYTDTSLGVNETENNRQFSFYPNPSNGILHLIGIQEETKIEIYSITGKKLFEKIVFDNSKIEIKLSTGLYLARFTSFSKTHSKKLLIN